MPTDSTADLIAQQPAMQQSLIDVTIRQWMRDVLRSHVPLLAIAVRQRAKFEGWLKFELAALAQQKGAERVEVESNSDPSAQTRADLTFWWHGRRCDVELKTANTNFRMEGVANLHRPITRNLSGIGRDAEKLRSCDGDGVVAFVLFPVRAADDKWREHIRRISLEVGTPVTPEANCELLTLPVSNSESASLVVCAFAVPKQRSIADQS